MKNNSNMSKFRVKIKYLAMAAAVAGIIFGAYQYQRPAEDRTLEKSEASLSAAVLHEIFIEGDSAQTTPLLNQIVLVSGQLQSAEGNTILLSPGVVCTLEDLPIEADWLAGTEVSVKGRILGFDDLFEEVQMDFCVLAPTP